jgi:hypothetical protein
MSWFSSTGAASGETGVWVLDIERRQRVEEKG